MGGYILNEKTMRLSLTGAIVILSIAILFSAFQISGAIIDASTNLTNMAEEKKYTAEMAEEKNRYELISPNDSNIIIFDKQSGDYWRKFIETSEGPTEWEKQKSPIDKSGN
jgi:hypothetical protein